MSKANRVALAEHLYQVNVANDALQYTVAGLPFIREIGIRVPETKESILASLQHEGQASNTTFKRSTMFTGLNTMGGDRTILSLTSTKLKRTTNYRLPLPPGWELPSFRGQTRIDASDETNEFATVTIHYSNGQKVIERLPIAVFVEEEKLEKLTLAPWGYFISFADGAEEFELFDTWEVLATDLMWVMPPERPPDSTQGQPIPIFRPEMEPPSEGDWRLKDNFVDDDPNFIMKRTHTKWGFIPAIDNDNIQQNQHLIRLSVEEPFLNFDNNVIKFRLSGFNDTRVDFGTFAIGTRVWDSERSYAISVFYDPIAKKHVVDGAKFFRFARYEAEGGLPFAIWNDTSPPLDTYDIKIYDKEKRVLFHIIEGEPTLFATHFPDGTPIPK